MPDICVVIPTYKRNNKIINTIRSLINQKLKPNEIIIVDNDPYSLLYNNIDNLKGIKISYYKQKENLGGAGGYAFGIKIAMEKGFNFIYTLDDDIICDENSVLNLVESEFFSNSNVLTSLIVSPSMEIEYMHHKVLDDFLEQHSVFLKNEKYINDIDFRYCLLDANSFAGLLIPAKIIKEVGYPNADYFIWYDDLEYTYRISRKFKIYLITKSIIIHDDDTFISDGKIRSIDIKNLYKVYYGIRNSLLFKLSNLKFKKRVIVVFQVLIRVLRLSLRVIKIENDKIKRLNTLWRGFFAGVFFIKKQKGRVK